MSKKQVQLIMIGMIVAVIASIFTIHQRGLYTIWATGSVDRIDPTEAYQLIEQEGLVILDARSSKEFNVSHLPGAIRYSADILDTLDPTQPVLVYCTISLRSNSLAKEMSDKGFKQVYDIKGGLVSWVNDQMELINASNDKTDTLHTYDKWLAPFVREGTPVY